MLRNSLLVQKGIRKKKSTGEKMIDLQRKTFTIPNNWTFDFCTVDESCVARPDLIAQYIYGADIYGDLICKINGISNPLEINEGDILIIPSINDIQKFFIKDSYEEGENIINADGTVVGKAKGKSKKDKRRANEAIMGDVRYRIDSAQKVIVY